MVGAYLTTLLETLTVKIKQQVDQAVRPEATASSFSFRRNGNIGKVFCVSYLKVIIPRQSTASQSDKGLGNG